MDDSGTAAGPPFGRHAVSRRGAPISGSTAVRAAIANSNSKQPPASPTGGGAKAKKVSNKKMEDDIEMRPLVSSHHQQGNDTITGSSNAHHHHHHHHHKSTSATTTAGSNHEKAAKFADSWFGAMLKLKAKEAEKHAYNLRANLKSKKGFHVQVPKRMLFYTVLVFLVLPLVLFFYKENHIHDHDPAYHDIKNHSANDSQEGGSHALLRNHSHTRHHHSSSNNDNNNNNNHHPQHHYGHDKKNNKDRFRGHANNIKLHHQSLQQLLGGSNNTITSHSRSNPGSAKSYSGGAPSKKSLRDDPLQAEVASSNNEQSSHSHVPVVAGAGEGRGEGEESLSGDTTAHSDDETNDNASNRKNATKIAAVRAGGHLPADSTTATLQPRQDSPSQDIQQGEASERSGQQPPKIDPPQEEEPDDGDSIDPPDSQQQHDHEGSLVDPNPSNNADNNHEEESATTSRTEKPEGWFISNETANHDHVMHDEEKYR